MTETPDAATVNAFNKNIVEEFRANDGKVAGPFANADLLLLTTTGAKSGESAGVAAGLFPHRRQADHHRILRRRPH